MKRAVYAKLQGTDAFVPGLGGLGTTLPPANKSFKEFEMYWSAGDALYVNITSLHNIKYEAVIPSANVQILSLLVEPKKLKVVEDPKVA